MTACGFQVQTHINIVLERDELPAERQHVSGRFEICAPLALDLVEVGQHSVKGAITKDQLGCGLRPYPGDPRHVIRGIAHQGQNVPDVVRLHAFGSKHLLRSDRFVLIDVQQVNMLADQLGEILVARDDADIEVGLFGRELANDGGDDIISFDPLYTKHGNAHQVEHLHASLNLGAEILRRLLTIGLVLGIEAGAEGFLVAADIDRHREIVRLVFTEQFEQDAHEPEGHVRRLLGDGAGHAGADGVIGPKELRMPVDEVEGSR